MSQTDFLILIKKNRMSIRHVHENRTNKSYRQYSYGKFKVPKILFFK